MSKSWVGREAIEATDKWFLTSPRERVPRIIATINLKELSSNLYDICAGCHPLMVSARLGVPQASGKCFSSVTFSHNLYEVF